MASHGEKRGGRQDRLPEPAPRATCQTCGAPDVPVMNGRLVEHRVLVGGSSLPCSQNGAAGSGIGAWPLYRSRNPHDE